MASKLKLIGRYSGAASGPGADATRVTWAIQGPMPYLSKVFSLFCDMDAMIGREFENGLADLKTIVER